MSKSATSKVKADVTLKDIAEVVGKSVAAVSRALNDHNDISSNTRTYIKQVAQEMGYTPNLSARRLQKRSTDTIGLILPVLSPRSADPFYSEILAGVTNESTRQGFDVLVSAHVNGMDESEMYHRLIDGRRVDGMIIVRPRWRDERLTVVAQRQFPHVVVGKPEFDDEVLSITDDMVEGATILVNHLIVQGHKRIGVVNTPLDLVSSAKFLAGFKNSMLQAGLGINEGLIETSNFTPKGGYRAGQLLLSKPEPPTAIIVADDIPALGVMAAAQDQGLEIGHDLAVTGYGNALLAEHAQPPLTTIQRSTYNFAEQACEMLIAKLKGKDVKDPPMVKPSLIIRQSSDLALWL
ncbi:LacI family DNA-binding transcriptional regulator [Anaerolineales bacterium HSG6]|nr:LacI family DNA-binding transcriptional regulator [Anaerolineales bacterium HSG6]MDM8532236.1 LacI family DNA-binding transcriptional regulator [Anaerolineales bacterium HSG25]